MANKHCAICAESERWMNDGFFLSSSDDAKLVSASEAMLGVWPRIVMVSSFKSRSSYLCPETGRQGSIVA